MGYKETYKDWLSWADDETKKELSALHDEKEIEDRFYRDLEFGTAGLRGIMGAGTNRMNRYTVARATKGLSEYLKALYPGELSRGLVIAYDSRNHSREFAVEAAAVLTASGIPVKIFKELEPIPVLSFSVRHFHALGGIVITASHNPPEYNGYKVYGEDGGQLVPKKADVLTEYVEKVKDLSAIDHRTREDLITWLGEDVVDLFIDTIFKESRYHGNPPPLKVVYTPLHGSGRVPVEKILGKAGFKDLLIVKEQEMPDGDFPTVSSPNPENEDALSLGIRLGKEEGADIVIGTDPDSDRIGAAVRKGSQFTLISGNQMGALLTYFLLSTGKDRLTPASTLVKTVVTGELAADIAESFHVQVVETLTGFKYIGEKITEWERNPAHDFVFGFEESYGYLSGTHVRDKDGVNAVLLVCEAADWYRRRGMTLSDAMDALYREFGYFACAQKSVCFSGAHAMQEMAARMARLREDLPETIAGLRVAGVTDYLTQQTGLPRADVLEFRLEPRAKLILRPSGTEPKLKLYLTAPAPSASAAKPLLSALEQGCAELCID